MERALAVNVLLALGVVLAFALAPAPAVADGGMALPTDQLDGAPARPLADLPSDLAAVWAGAAMVDVGGGCSGVLIAPVPATTQDPDAPAYVLTNGHCIDMLPPTDVRRDLPGSGGVTFGWPGSAVSATAAVAAIPWASMKDTDIAVLQLDRTLADLAASGVPAYPLAATLPPDGTRIAIVGAPAPDDGSERQLTLTTCTLLPPVDLVEAAWSWSDFPADRCDGIRHGSSGSPVFDVGEGTLVGLVNTGTMGSAGRSDCMFDRPCEVRPGVAVSVEDAVYGPSVAGLAACFDARGRFRGPGGDCPLDPGIGLRVEGATEVTNPDARRPDGRPSPTTWNARLVADDPALAWYRTKTGPLGSVDCHDPAGYGAPVALAAAPVVDARLPDAEGRYQLCLLAGPGPIVDARWQQPRFATVVTTWVDRTPPIPAVEVEVAVDARARGWTVTPREVPPELVTFTWKAGPAATTACADPEGYRVWRHSPIRVAAADGAGPQRVCVVGHDPAGNPAPFVERVLDPATLPAPTPSPPPTPGQVARGPVAVGGPWSAPRDPSGAWPARAATRSIDA